MIMEGISQPAYFIGKICRRSLFMVRYMKSCIGIAECGSGQLYRHCGERKRTASIGMIGDTADS